MDGGTNVDGRKDEGIHGTTTLLVGDHINMDETRTISYHTINNYPLPLWWIHLLVLMIHDNDEWQWLLRTVQSSNHRRLFITVEAIPHLHDAPYRRWWLMTDDCRWWSIDNPCTGGCFNHHDDVHQSLVRQLHVVQALVGMMGTQLVHVMDVIMQ